MFIELRLLALSRFSATEEDNDQTCWNAEKDRVIFSRLTPHLCPAATRDQWAQGEGMQNVSAPIPLHPSRFVRVPQRGSGNGVRLRRGTRIRQEKNQLLGPACSAMLGFAERRD